VLCCAHRTRSPLPARPRPDVTNAVAPGLRCPHPPPHRLDHRCRRDVVQVGHRGQDAPARASERGWASSAHQRSTRYNSRMHRVKMAVRRTVLWVAPGAGAVVAILWAACAWWSVTFSGHHGIWCQLANGALTCVWLDDRLPYMSGENARAGWTVEGSGGPYVWKPHAEGGAQSGYLVVPLWMAFALCVAAAGAAWWWCRPRPNRVTACQQCGYDRTGSVSSVCPECGQHADGRPSRR
jgi:hypothetical protein